VSQTPYQFANARFPACLAVEAPTLQCNVRIHG
jgi:hypothetical protein